MPMIRPSTIASTGFARPIRRLALLPALLAVLAAAPLALSGCSPVGIAVGAGAAGATATQSEKGFRQTVDDTRIRAQLNGVFFTENSDLFRKVSFTVEEGRVLLTGNVPTPEDRVTAVRLAWSVEGVREVINEIEISDTSSLSDSGRDLVIASKLRGQLLLDEDVSSINYSIDVVNAVVYVMGIALSEDELQRVLGHARNVPRVRRVVNHARVAGTG